MVENTGLGYARVATAPQIGFGAGPCKRCGDLDEDKSKKNEPDDHVGQQNSLHVPQILDLHPPYDAQDCANGDQHASHQLQSNRPSV